MYCQNCLKIILEKLTNNDVILLEQLYNEKSTIPQCALSGETINESLNQDFQLSPHTVFTSLKRLNEFGFIETQKWTRRKKYYITKDGINLLNIVKGNME